MRTPKFKVVLYQNGKRIKTFANFRTYPEAQVYYTQKIQENQVFFSKEINWLGIKLEYEIAILGKKGKKLEYVENEFGLKTQIEMKEGSEYFIKNINPFYIEENFKYWNKNEMINFRWMIKNVLMRTLTTKVIYCFNNKVLIIDDETDDYHLFIVKCESDSIRLTNLLRKFCITNKITSVLFFYENFESGELYPKIIEKLGIKRTELWKITTH